MGFLKSATGLLDVQVIAYTVFALIPNLLLILWAVARLSRDVRLLRTKADMIEHDINLLDQSISDISAQLQAIRRSDLQARVGKDLEKQSG
jgi:hypothetical protein